MALIVVATLMAAAAWIIWRPAMTSSWVFVDVAGPAVVGAPLRMRVRVDPPYPAKYVSVDLHWATNRHEPRGFLTAAPVHMVPLNGAPLEVELMVGERPNFGHVYAVVYVGPSGQWDDHVAAAASEQLPVLKASGWPTASRWQPWPMYDPELEPWPKESSMLVRWLAAIGFVGAAAYLYGGWRRAPGQTVKCWRPRSVGYLLMGLCVLAALWELLDLTSVCTAAAERLAMESSHYSERRALQRPLTFAAVASALGLIALVVLRPMQPGRRALAIGLTAFGALVATTVVSLHGLDGILRSPWHGVPAYQWATLVASTLAFIGARHMALDGGGVTSVHGT